MRSFWNKLMASIEKSAQRRAAIELRRMGYTPERLREMMTK